MRTKDYDRHKHRPYTYSYLIDYVKSDKKSKRIKKCLIKRKTKFNNYKNYLINDEIILKSQQKLKSEAHNVDTEEINKIALSSNDDKRYQTLDKTASYPYGANVGKVCKTELLNAMSNIK